MPAQTLRSPQRLLVVKLADLGDAIGITPALLALRVGLPTATIDLLTTPSGERAIAGLPLVDHVLSFPKHRFDSPRALLQPANLRAAYRLADGLRRGAYDTVVILHHLTTRFGAAKYRSLVAAAGAARSVGLDNGRGHWLTDRVVDQGFGAKHESDYWLQVVARVGGRTDGAVLVPPPAEPWALAPVPPAGRVALHPGSGAFAPARRWPVARWAALTERLLTAGVEVVLVGGAEERQLRAALLDQVDRRDAVQDLGGRTSVAELCSILRQSDLFVGNDSGIVHLAAAVGTPVVAPYGPTHPAAWGPWHAGGGWTVAGTFANGVRVLRSGPHAVLHADLPCSPCLYREHHLGSPHGCPDRTCLARIGIDQMFMVVQSRLADRLGMGSASPSWPQVNA